LYYYIQTLEETKELLKSTELSLIRKKKDMADLSDIIADGVYDILEIGDHPSITQAAQAPQGYVPPPVVTLFGSNSPSSTSNVIVKAFAVIIGFISQDYLDALLEEVDGLSIFILIALLLVIWKFISDPAREWIRWNVEDKGMGWRDELIDIVDYISYIVMFIVFGYFGRIVFQYAKDIGVNITELNLIGIIAVIYLYDIYRRALEEFSAKSSSGR